MLEDCRWLISTTTIAEIVRTLVQSPQPQAQTCYVLQTCLKSYMYIFYCSRNLKIAMYIPNLKKLPRVSSWNSCQTNIGILWCVATNIGQSESKRLAKLTKCDLVSEKHRWNTFVHCSKCQAGKIKQWSGLMCNLSITWCWCIQCWSDVSITATCQMAHTMD